MSKLTIVATIVAKDGHAAFIKEELLKLIDFTRAENGCISYDLHQDNGNENFFLFYENWENRDLWQEHMKNEHLARYLKVTDGFVDEFILREMTHIE